MFEEKMKIIYFFSAPVTFSLKNARPPAAAPSLTTLSTFNICVRCLKFFGLPCLHLGALLLSLSLSLSALHSLSYS